MWPFNTGGCVIKVTTFAGLAVVKSYCLTEVVTKAGLIVCYTILPYTYVLADESQWLVNISTDKRTHGKFYENRSHLFPLYKLCADVLIKLALVCTRREHDKFH